MPWTDSERQSISNGSDARAGELIIRQLYRAAGCPQLVTNEERFRKCRCNGGCSKEDAAGSNLCGRCTGCTSNDCCTMGSRSDSGSQEDEDGPSGPSPTPKERRDPMGIWTTPEADKPREMEPAAQWGQPMQRRAIRRLRAGLRRSRMMKWRTKANARKYGERQAERRKEATRGIREAGGGKAQESRSAQDIADHG